MQYLLSDLIAIPDIQRMLDTFESGSGIATEIRGMHGEIIVASSSRKRWHEVHPDILRFRQSVVEISVQSNEKSGQRDDPLSGLIQYSGAIRVEDRELGTLFLGPVFHTQPDDETFRQLAKKFGLDEKVYLDKVKRVPVVNEDQAQSYVEILVPLIQSLAKRGLDEKYLIESLAASQEQEAKLQSAYKDLETRVQERTEELQRANESLQESEQRFRVALIGTPIIMFNQDLDLRYTWIYNAEGYADQPVVGKTDADLFPAKMPCA
jgi:ligand-binding sensor protein